MSKSIPRKYLGAFKKGHRSYTREFIDEELSQKLLKKAEEGCLESQQTLAYLTQFNNEYHKAVIKKDDPNALHKTKEQRAECDHRDYSGSTDFYALNKTKIQGDEF